MEILHELVFLVPMTVGFYWWFARGRPIGLLFSFLAVLTPALVLNLATGLVLPDSIVWVISLVMLLVAWNLSPGSSKTCPFCAEFIKEEAAVCRYCGRNVPPKFVASEELPAPPRPKAEGLVFPPGFKHWSAYSDGREPMPALTPAAPTTASERWYRR